MRHYPINLNLGGRLVVVVGGGKVAARKAARLVAAGACVTVVAPGVEESLAALAAQGRVMHLPRGYRSGDLAGATLAFAATGDPAVNREVARDARELNILVDCVDLPDDGDFVTPAVLEQGDLLITVSTGGASPSLSKTIVDRLRPQFGPEYGEAVALLSAVREKLLTEKAGNAYNDTVFAELAALDIPALIKNGQRDAIDQILLKLSAAGAAPGSVGAGKEDPS
ncbi:bifunctional precorrin-2 dehydrogenase/sirohydrochlorin ferrochelatase [Geomonas sp. Red69]|uniref:precorrin-2 dehydrogenase n=1 Tax=Geomonas diazotrophica TaxID=2843197 RepID=A0ABX8JL32_9BACT|nr:MULTISPECIES: bifunctional precorrin-2 dehydrogenase/sirohydrochlorin ferrochelatase [Geomonas]MBU5637473.1 bifunctional precorrin-2 dehydrogenase/sirohydrochlorin ferrochelatase [Geomonas diazotrophica]QWV97861.1 bifunctional precorrin-2 dehydrogenase/sirohydrochlorin ferrochelatase [Geomonas nitrogeniifigens]QXE87001.1 bifunctional precorrin-2 dehydrogenase/sirohydrochlorin ferrochelatase [Geomonas nitrogeniifigens]